MKQMTRNLAGVTAQMAPARFLLRDTDSRSTACISSSAAFGRGNGITFSGS
jgi:hypothetical protein